MASPALASDLPPDRADNADCTDRPDQTNLRGELLAVGLVVLLTTAVLWPLCRAQFTLWDDPHIIYNNASLTPPAWGNVRLWWTQPHQRLYTPVAYTIWGLLAWAAQVPADPATGIDLNPHVFHTANLCIHLLTSAVAYFLLRRLVGRRWPAAAGALIFSLHPVQVESVGHASGIQGLLCGLFGLAAVYLYVRSMNGSGSTTAPLKPGFYAAATVAFVLAALSKPAAMTVPLLAGLIEVLWLGRSVRAALLRLWPWFLVALACGAVVRAIQKPMLFDVFIPIYYRPLITGYTLAFYAYKILFPLRLGVVYPRATPAELTSGDVIYYAWMVPAALAALAWQTWRKQPRLRPALVGVAWFVTALLPVLGLTRFDFQILSTVADRYLYLPMFGLALSVAWLLARPRCRGHPAALAATCAVVLAALSIRSHLQTHVWHDNDSLFRNAHKVNPAGGIE